jgi:hypothetical protein
MGLFYLYIYMLVFSKYLFKRFISRQSYNFQQFHLKLSYVTELFFPIALRDIFCFRNERKYYDTLS